VATDTGSGLDDLSRQGKALLAAESTVCIFQRAITELGGMLWMTQTAWRLLWVLIGSMEPGNYVYYSMAEGARRTGMSYGVTRRAWQVLTTHELLRLGYDTAGVPLRWRLSPYLCWRGRPWKARVAQKNWDAERQLTALAQSWDNGDQTPG